MSGISKNNDTGRPNQQSKHALVFLTAISLLVGSIAGCATVPAGSKTQPQPIFADSDNKGWWYARFRFNWPDDSEPDWHLDPLVADRIVAPVLEQYRKSIDLWRFHRRAGNDQAGHQLSFIFYSDSQTASQIYQALEIKPELQALLADGKIENVGFDNPSKITKPAIEDTSDKTWPKEIQKSWPYFIMGASEMWLSLIHQLVAEQSDNRKNQDDIYRLIHDQLLALWKHEGNHALLHHLNALYGYQPLIVIDRKLMNF